MHGIGYFLQACVSSTLGVVVRHIVLVLEERVDGDSVSLGALVRERFAGLDVEYVWRAVLQISLARISCR
jgi:hypothetical protein